ncbi:uncharacterized protein LOC131949053 [Physella acuta]|uniref:uncharacterized protein LOC131949053 n=1 Tax=Physella acuta TaxID=109671 RepID=UPI0027DB38CF|nr:uncharacterized protein LOC131949053 [Physella acuta]
MNESDYYDSLEDVEKLIEPVLFSSSIIMMILGTLVNIFLVSAILTSPVLRLKLKNRIIAMMCVCFLGEVSLEIARSILEYKEIHFTDYHFWNLYINTHVIEDFISLWYVVVLLIIYIAKLYDLDPSRTLSLKFVKLGSAVILVIPLILSATIIPVMIESMNSHSQDYLSIENMLKLRAVSTITPFIVAIVLTVVAGVIYRRRFSHGFLGQSTCVDLINRGTVVDRPVAYIIATSVCVVCYAVHIFFTVYLVRIVSLLTEIRLYIVDEVLQDVFTYLLPLSWLFLDDLRERIKTWRPWRRTRQNIHITVSYSKEEILDESHAEIFL